MSVKYNIINKSKNKLLFDIIGDENIGLNKSIINAIRRTLHNYINVVGISENSVEIHNNDTSLHNEFMKDRISLMHIYLNSSTYNKDYVFVIDVINDSTDVLKITSKDIDIYPLKKDILNSSLITSNDINNYDLSSKLTEKEKENILRPFEFESKKYYSLITELPLNNTEPTKLKLYAYPSVYNGTNSSKYNNIACAFYTFKKDNNLFQSKLKEVIKIEKIKSKKDKEQFSKTFELSNSDRYYYRDHNNEPYWYEFNIESYTYESPKDLYIKSCSILIDQLNQFSEKLKLILSDQEDTDITITMLKNDTSYQIKCTEHNESIIAMVQNKIVEDITDESLITTCGYKKLHPLKTDIIINLSVKPHNYDINEMVTYLIKDILDSINKLQSQMNIMKDIADQDL